MNVIVPVHKGLTQVLVSIPDMADLSPEHVKVDLWPSRTL